ncbi:hypothetical protein [Streptomyces sp. enrichment culture]|uniref:golvesin C-terminal-like domain-containing protein n=1 Tax=Streptomyces sp. enrichment culture TaxID=1795815 RepID=UPI003F56177F
MPVTVTVATALAIPLSLPAQAADPAPPKGAAQGWSSQPKKKNPAMPSAVPVKERAETLGARYRTSEDTAFTTSGDGTGFHLLVADEAKGYGWKTAATLREDGFDADTWIGNACLTASGDHAAVAYAPRTFTNRPELMVRGAFTAVVDLDSGKVTKLPFTASLAYFSPGCGNGERAVFTQLTHDGDEKQRTRLITVDARTGKRSEPVTFPGQVTSAIPAGKGIVAAHGNRLVRLDGAEETELVRTRTVPFQLTADADGGVTFIERELDKKVSSKPQSWAKYLTPAKTRGGRTTAATVATGKLAEWDLTGTASGRVFITGKATSKGELPARIANPGGLAKGARMSSLGHVAVSTAWADGRTSLITPEEAEAPRSARTRLEVLATGRTVTLDAKPDARGKHSATGTRTSPALPAPAEPGEDDGGPSPQTARVQALAASPSSPSEGTDERYCAVARNDVKKQAFQPTPRQVEWAVDQAVVGKLDFYRSPNWKNTGMGGYQPQGLFPPIVLEGDPNGTLDTEDGDNDKWHIPAQVLLGITAQESNMWQATRFAVPGVTANSLVGNYYGIDYTADGTQADPWRINWSDADCGYGITQATDGMRLAGKEKEGETALSTLTQEAVALDYTANIAYGAQILSDKWNQTRRAGMKINDGHPRWIENWFFALWAYNSGFYENADSAGHKGVGWTNNPANPLWKANRVPFLQNALDASRDDYSHAAHPQDWPYEEKVIGWAARPISAMFAPGDFQAGYRPAWWNSVVYRSTAKPPIDLFCDASNDCDPSKIGDNDSNDPGLGACRLDGGDSSTNPHWLHCWWDKSAQWKDCADAAQCGYAVHRFNTSYPEQPDAASYPPRCDSGLPADALIVDDLPNGTVPAGSASRGCGAVKSDGTFGFTYRSWDLIDSDTGQTVTTYPGKIDTHQIGAAYQNHFWFTHTRSPESYPPPGDRMQVTGTWKLTKDIPGIGMAKVYAHIPDHGAQTSKAEYRIKHDHGTTVKAISQDANQSNKWVDLGAYWFNSVTPEVALDNFNGGDGSKDIAYDAIAFVPGDYSGIPADLTFGDPDPNAPDPVPTETPNTIDGSFFEAAGARAAKAQTRSAFETPEAGAATAQAATAVSSGATAACSIVEKSMTYNRTDACIHDDLFVTHFENNVPDGQAQFDYRNEIDTDVNSDTFTQRTTIKLTGMTGAMNKVDLDLGYECRGYCTVVSSTWSGSSTWLKGDTHTSIVTTKIKWSPAGQESGLIVPYWTFGGSTNGDAIANPMTVEKTGLDVRCDVEVKTTPGCVFSWYKPTYAINHKKFPAAAAHIWLVQNKLPGGFGLKGKRPLTFLSADVLVPSPPDSTKTLEDHNRGTICPTGWARTTNPQPTMSFELGASDVPSCDEFPFARSWESAAIPKSWGGKNLSTVTSGDGCLNTVAVKDANGLWRLAPDANSPVPDWNEPCGRSSMSNNQNTQSMSLFPTFRRDNRVIEGDQYWVEARKP